MCFSMPPRRDKGKQRRKRTCSYIPVACNHDIRKGDPHDACEACRRLYNEGKLCTPESRCDKCEDLTDEQFADLLKHRERNRVKREQKHARKLNESMMSQSSPNLTSQAATAATAAVYTPVQSPQAQRRCQRLQHRQRLLSCSRHRRFNSNSNSNHQHRMPWTLTMLH